jgi:hypothetical protein
MAALRLGGCRSGHDQRAKLDNGKTARQEIAARMTVGGGWPVRAADQLGDECGRLLRSRPRTTRTARTTRTPAPGTSPQDSSPMAPPNQRLPSESMLCPAPIHTSEQ